MSFDAWIRELWEEEEHYEHSDFGSFDRGLRAGIKLGQRIGQESGDLKWKKNIPETFGVGYRQGLSYAAFQASHMSIDNNELAVLTVPEAAILMRECIVSALLAAVKAEETRANAKVEPIL